MDISRALITDELIEELHPLLLLHNEEVRDMDIVDYNLNWYRQLQHGGRYELYVARKEGKLIGYAGYHIATSPHHKSTMYAVCDLIYIIKKQRGKRGLVSLLDFAEADFKNKSIKYTSMSVRPHHDFGPILERRGYNMKEIVYLKEL